MVKMNFFKALVMLLLSIGYSGLASAIPKYDLTGILSDFVSPQQAIVILSEQNSVIQQDMVALKDAGDLTGARDLRLKSVVYSGVMQSITNVNDVEMGLSLYFSNSGVVTPANKVLQDLTNAQVNAYKTEITERLRS
jgi:hypothetical protein